MRLWKPPIAAGENKAFGLYRAENEPELDRLLSALPPNGWMRTAAAPLGPHPNDPRRPEQLAPLPEPRLTPV